MRLPAGTPVENIKWSKLRRKSLQDTGRGTVGKTAVVGAKDRKTRRVAAKIVDCVDTETLHGFVGEHAAPGAKVYSNDASAYSGLLFGHQTVKHTLFQYVRGDVHTNSIESL